MNKARYGPGNPNLTPREQEVLNFFGQGYTYKEIAEALFVSVKTVEAHRAHAMGKLRIKTSGEFMRVAIAQHIETIDIRDRGKAEYEFVQMQPMRYRR